MTPLLAAAFLAAGFAVGAGYFAALRRSIELYLMNLKNDGASPAKAGAHGASAALVGPVGPGFRRDSELEGENGSRQSRHLGPIGITLARIGGAIVFFAIAVHFGALALLAAFLGFLAARAVALRAARGEA